MNNEARDATGAMTAADVVSSSSSKMTAQNVTR